MTDDGTFVAIPRFSPQRRTRDRYRPIRANKGAVMAKEPSGSILHATMSKTADGMFKAEYPGELNPEASDARELPDSHLGTSEREVRLWVEQMAKSLGY